MNEIEFIESIDACFPYGDEVKRKHLIELGVSISDNASFMVLHEICRAPISKSVNTENLLVVLKEWEEAYDHPLKKSVVEAGKSIMNRTYLSNTKSIEIMKEISEYRNMFNALSIAYFSSEDPNDEIEKVYDDIINLWRAK